MKSLLFLLALISPMAYADDVVTVKGIDYHTGLIPSFRANPPRVLLNGVDYPLEYDAVASGAATPVKDDGQGQCGDCWAWARTSSLEAAAIKAGLSTSTLKLSEEDTTVNASDEYGCGGGFMDFNYEVSHGVTLQSNCPFTEGETRCSAAPVVKGVSMAYVGGSDGPTDEQLEAAIYSAGSVAVTVAACGSFDVSDGDRMTDCGCSGVNHMVSLVGYRPAPGGGVEFKMKNSWGPSWGAHGYAYMKRGCNEIATGDQSAMIISASGNLPPPPPPPPPQGWQCTAKSFLGSAYDGKGDTRDEASADALSACKSAGRWGCRVKSCQQVN